MTPSKPHGVCWCDCHRPVDDHGVREFKPWPRFDEPVALATACVKCKDDHTLFVTTGRDWLWDKGTLFTLLPHDFNQPRP